MEQSRDQTKERENSLDPPQQVTGKARKVPGLSVLQFVEYGIPGVGADAQLWVIKSLVGGHFQATDL